MKHMRSILGLISTLAMMSCGSEQYTGKASGKKSNASSNASASSEDATPDLESAGHDTRFDEDKVDLAVPMQLASLGFAPLDAAHVAANSLNDYMVSNDLSIALLLFCNQASAACKVAARDIALNPIASGDKNFAVIGVATPGNDDGSATPAFVKFDDRQSNVLGSSLQEDPSKDVAPYFVLVFRGETKEGIVWRTSLERIFHAELKTKVETFLGQIGA